jgi:gamma-glutamyltranspeptidase / glutathione hydrolase
MVFPVPETHASQLTITRSTAHGNGGAVAGKMRVAVQTGIDILAAGGNAFDSAVATAFAMGVAEPWMNGIGGGGFLVGWLASEQRAFTVEYPMISGSLAREDMYPLTGGVDAGLFGWPKTQDSANVLGYGSIAVPGTVAGLALALERYGTMSLAQVLEPAIRLAEEGVPVTWHTTLTIARDLVNLRRFPATAATYLTRHESPPVTLETVNPAMIRNSELANTLRAIVDGGPRVMYEGEIGATIANHLAENGSPVTREDFAGYEARESAPLNRQFKGHAIHTMDGGSGGTSLAQALGIADRLGIDSGSHNSAEVLHKLAYSFRQAFADRFTYLADPESVDVPIDALLCDAYLDAAAGRFDASRATAPAPGSKTDLGVRHQLAGSVPEYMRDGSTTHLGVIDRAGNAVSLTQTLLSLWGSRVVVPGTGVLMNNGMMWFDPEPGRPNSVGPRKRPLANMAPALVIQDGRAVASIGSSGGRKIMNCNAQLITNMTAFGLPIDEALAAPRIDASNAYLMVSSRLDPAVPASLRELGYEVRVADETQLLGSFASPVAIGRTPDGTFEAAVDAWYFPATAMALP